MDKYQEVMEPLVQFRNEPDRVQFHNPKNLTLLKASKLNELFLWKKENETEFRRKDHHREKPPVPRLQQLHFIPAGMAQQIPEQHR